MIPRLGFDPASPFPDVRNALETPDGLLAWGGDLKPARLEQAYRHGIFPWYSDDQPILWWSPARRCVIRPEEVYVSSSLERVIRQKRFRITADRAFADVVAGCAAPRPGQDSTWITPAMAQAYQQMHLLGFAHSVEVWSGSELTGGIYGLCFGRMFFGESMFSRARDASKVALVSLCRQLAHWKFSLLDCQVANPHLFSMGAAEISREAFCEYLRANPECPELRGTWSTRFDPIPPTERKRE